MVPNRSCSNGFEDFVSFCEHKGINLTKEQSDIAKQIFSLPVAGGKTTLTALLYAYDPAAESCLKSIG